MDAWKGLTHHCNQNRHLKELVYAFRNDKDRAFSKRYSDLRSEVVPNEQSATDLLEQVESEVFQLLPVLLLFPELGLIPHLIDELERAHRDGRELSHIEQLLLQRLQVVDTLIRQDGLGDSAAWQKITDTLAGWDGSDRGSPSRKSDGNSGGV